MNLLVIADDESVARSVPDCQADLLISCGDMPDQVMLQLASRCGCREVLAIKGNHDSSGLFSPPIRDLHLTTFEFGGVTFGGFCGSWKYKPRGNYLFEEHEVEQSMRVFPAVDVFVAHNSPRLVHDRDDEVHIGFAAFGNYIARAGPSFFLHGHQHQDVVTAIGKTRVIGIYGSRFLIVPD